MPLDPGFLQEFRPRIPGSPAAAASRGAPRTPKIPSLHHSRGSGSSPGRFVSISIPYQAHGQVSQEKEAGTRLLPALAPVELQEREAAKLGVELALKAPEKPQRERGKKWEEPERERAAHRQRDEKLLARLQRGEGSAGIASRGNGGKFGFTGGSGAGSERCKQRFVGNPEGNALAGKGMAGWVCAEIHQADIPFYSFYLISSIL